VAKSLRALQEFQLANDENKVIKKYQALLIGDLPPDLKKIESRLDIRRASNGHKRARVSESGKYASTIIEKKLPYGLNTLAYLKLETGRMHQIRAHCLHVGFPIAGDREYGSMEGNKRLRQHGLSRLFLHSFCLRFRTTLCDVDVSSPLPDELEALLTKLK
jgi:23S rRNA pseudouridine955/2504/2580 synthase